MQRRQVFYDKHVGVHLSLHLLSNVLDLALTVHGQKVQLLVYELQSVLTVLLGLKAVDPTQTQKHTHTCKQTHTHTNIQVMGSHKVSIHMGLQIAFETWPTSALAQQCAQNP